MNEKSQNDPEDVLRAQTVPGGMTDIEKGSAGGELSSAESRVAPTGTSGARGPTFHTSQAEQTGTSDMTELEIEREGTQNLNRGDR